VVHAVNRIGCQPKAVGVAAPCQTLSAVTTGTHAAPLVRSVWIRVIWWTLHVMVNRCRDVVKHPTNPGNPGNSLHPVKSRILGM